MPAGFINPILCLYLLFFPLEYLSRTLMFVHIFSFHLSGDLQMKYAGDIETPLQNSKYIEVQNLQQYDFDPNLKPMFSTCLFVFSKVGSW